MDSYFKEKKFILIFGYNLIKEFIIFIIKLFYIYIRKMYL